MYSAFGNIINELTSPAGRDVYVANNIIIIKYPAERCLREVCTLTYPVGEFQLRLTTVSVRCFCIIYDTYISEIIYNNNILLYIQPRSSMR